MKAATISNWERKLRPLITKLPPKIVVSKYSSGRLDFLDKLKLEIPSKPYSPPTDLSVELWGITFLSPIMNAAGMFKNGECYEMVAMQGAGAYLGGTGTWNPRIGNKKEGVHLPFAPYPNSHSNWLGLPNDGDNVNSNRAAKLKKILIPIGWSIMGSPDLQGDDKLRYLVEGMRLYEKASVDFIEINESCPNTQHGRPQDDDLANRLNYIKQNFLDQRSRRLPVIVKFSNDTHREQVPNLMDLLFGFNFDGVNFGNTSTAYEKRRVNVVESERKLYDFFTQIFGGGISGRPLKESSLELAGTAAEYLKSGSPSQEFHVIRTGGVETLQDIQESKRAGVLLNQWFTGYFEEFSKHGHNVYRRLFSI